MDMSPVKASVLLEPKTISATPIQLWEISTLASNISCCGCDIYQSSDMSGFVFFLRIAFFHLHNTQMRFFLTRLSLNKMVWSEALICRTTPRRHIPLRILPSLPKSVKHKSPIIPSAAKSKLNYSENLLHVGLKRHCAEGRLKKDWRQFNPGRRKCFRIRFCVFAHSVPKALRALRGPQGQ